MGDSNIGQNLTSDRYDSMMQKKMRRNLIISAIYQLIIGIFWGIIPRFLLEIQIDMLAPLSIGNIPYIYGISAIILILVIIQFLLAIFINIFKDTPLGKILGWIIGVFMLLFLPIGTFYGIQFLQNLSQPNISPLLTKDQVSVAISTRELFFQSVTERIIISGLFSLFTAGVILWIHKLLLTQQLDMLFPIITTAKLIAIERFGQIFFILFCFQIFVGCIYSSYASKSWMRILVIGLSIFQIISIGIIIQWYLAITVPVMDLEEDSRVIVHILVWFSFLLGLPINPLGVYFGFTMLRAVHDEKSIR
jgi:hypothetical protein